MDSGGARGADPAAVGAADGPGVPGLAPEDGSRPAASGPEGGGALPLACDECGRELAYRDALCCHGDEGQQPAPSGGSGDVWLELIGHVAAHHPELHGLLPAMAERRRVGIERYGVPLGRGDGRDGRRDLAEELADASAYAQRLGLTELAVRLLREWAGVVR